MSSLKMTFSLTSLILIFGLVFVTMPVMAHDDASNDTSTPRPHSHPLTEDLAAATDAADVSAGRAGTEVTAHGAHPTVMSIVAKEHATLRANEGQSVILLDSTGNAVLAIDGVAAGQFTVTVTFSGTLASDAELESNEVTLRARYANGNPVSTPPTVNVTVDGDAGQNVFDVTIDVPQATYWDTDATPPATLLPLEVFVDINTDAVATGTTVDGNGNTLNPAASDEYMSGATTKFTVVETLPDAPADDPPTVDSIVGVVNDAGDAAVFTITFSEALDETIGSSAALAASDFVVTNGTADEPVVDATDAKVYTLTVTPTNPAEPVTIMLEANAVDNLNGIENAEASDVSDPVVVQPDSTDPTVEITVDNVLNSDDDVVFTLTFSEPLATTGAGALTLAADIVVTNGTDAVLGMPTVNIDTGEEVYELTVTPTDPLQPVMVEIDARSVIQDLYENDLDVTDATNTLSASFDDKRPTAIVTAPLTPESDGKLKFTLDFSEEINEATLQPGTVGVDNVEAIGNAVQDSSDPTIYTILVTPEDPMEDTRVEIADVRDLAGNLLVAEAADTYEVPGPPVPPIVITALPDPINCESGSTISFAITGTTETLGIGDITVSAGWKVGTDNDPADGSIDIVPNGDGSEIGVTTVTVSVAANAVDNNVATTKTFTVGPILTIPAGGYITVIRPEHINATHLQDPLIVGSLGVRGGVVSIQPWECMPDLTIFFGRAAPGIGGGALVVKESHANNSTTNPVVKGTVGISEIMWATDLSNTLGGLPIGGQSNLDQTREQWIELHNVNNHEVKVTLFARPTNDALTAESDEIDRVSNFNVRNAWDVPGQNGDSARGIDFISMQRRKGENATAAKHYAHGDFNGSASGQWSASEFTYLRRLSGLRDTGQLAAENLTYDFMGTPGRSNKVGPTGAPVATNVPRSPFVINEVANSDNRLYEWIEIRNSSTATANLRNYLISTVTAVGTEEALFTFPNVDNAHLKLEPNELILVVSSDPEDDAEHPLAVGYDVLGGNDQAQGVNENSARYIVAGSNEKLHTEGLPDNGEFVLFLRRSEKVDAANAKNKLKTHEWVIDIAGYHPNLAQAGTYTSLWPLKAYPAPSLGHNKFEVNQVHRRQHAGIDGTRTVKDGNHVDQTAFRNMGYTGIGYRRHASNSAAHGGTPGYHDIRKGTVADLTGIVTISEIMFDRGGDRGNYPQWIELYNSSATEAVNLRAGDGWRLEVQNYDDGEIAIDMISGTLNFKSSEVQTLLPQQTVLIASTRARNTGSSSVNAGVVFIPTRVFSVWSDARGALGMTRSTDPILSEEAFHLRLIDGAGKPSDEAGNLTQRRVRGEDAYWNWSEVRGDEMDARSSVIRRYGVPEKDARTDERWDRFDDEDILDMGIEAAGWVDAANTDFRDVERTWYGDEDDYGTPGTTTGRPLPVSLSKFRPERLDDGAVVIRWITESELNNAGFNILRSDTRKGQFTQINTSLIAGKGTTSERTTYEWKDSTAKPNVVYYYQIQDVSLDGQVQTLRQSRLKGDISAAGKLTTTWGELKALQ